MLDLALLGLDLVSRDSEIVREYHLEPLVTAAGALHTAVYQLEQRLAGVTMRLPRKADTSA